MARTQERIAQAARTASAIRSALDNAEEGAGALLVASLGVGHALATRGKGVTVDEVWEPNASHRAARLYSRGSLSRLETVARVYMVGAGIADTRLAAVPGGWGALYSAYLDLVKPGKCSAEEAVRLLEDGDYVRNRGSKAPAPGTHRMLRVTTETGERFDAYAEATGAPDTDTAVQALLGESVPHAVAAAVAEYLAVGTPGDLVRVINTAAVKARAKAA